MDEINFNQDELTRYSRHISLPQVNLSGQQKLKTARVLCIGAGGLGSPLLLYLAAAGVGTLGIVDDDSVDASNLQRQILYSTHELNLKKAQVAKNKLQALNPHINLIIHEERLTKENALSLISQYDIIADGTDNFTTRYIVNDACFHLKKPNVYASIFQFEGQCSIFATEQGPCYRCLYDAPPPPGLVPNCAEGGVLGVLPGLLGTIQATEVIKLILGVGSSLIGRLLTVDALTMRFQEFKLQQNPACRLCHHHQPFETLPHHDVPACDLSLNTDEQAITVEQLQALRQQQADFTLLDVREPYEYSICNLDGYLIPLQQLAGRLSELDATKPIIIHCKAGPRSQQAAQLLRQAGFSSVRYLVGGILAWAKQIDPSLTSY